MEFCQHIALLIIGVLAVANAKFYIAVPSTLRLNTDESIGIVFMDRLETGVQIQVKSHTETGNNIFTGNYLLKPGAPEIIKIKLDIAQFPAGFFTTPGSQKFVTLIISSRTVRKTISIPISSQYGYMFIHSDKPIYTPLERASFRIIPLTEAGIPSNETFQFQLRNPDGIVVDEKLYTGRRRLQNYFVTHTYSFGIQPYPKLGEWTAVARYGSNFELNSTLAFDLLEYVLPTFIVNITSPQVILPDDKTISVSVEAKYAYGEDVNGIVSFRFGLMKDHTTVVNYFWSFEKVTNLDKGTARINLETRHLKTHIDARWFESNVGSIFVVEATVVDEATGNKVIEVDSKSRLSRSPFLISVKRCLSDFKPGLISVFEADITYINGRPAAGITTRLRAVADRVHALNLVRDTTESDENGKVSFEIHPESHHREVVLTLETVEQKYGANQAKGVCVQRAVQSNNMYIFISRSSQGIVKPNGIFKRDIYLEPKEIKNVYFLVLARGRIQMFNKLVDGQFKVNKIAFRVTHDMVPSFRVVVFTQHNNQLLADSLKIDVEKVCSPEAEVKLEARFGDQEPGSDGVITMRGARRTSVGLFGVDKAVYAMARSDILRKEKLLDELGTHDLGCGPGGGLNVNSVLGNAGIMIVTDRYTSSHSHSCGAIRRRKRSIVENIVNRYTGREQVCCGLGLRLDRYGRMCDDRQWTIEKELDEIHENCSQIFFECCTEGETLDVNGTVYFPMGRNLAGNGIQILDPDRIAEIESITTARKEFKETWFNNNYVIGSNNFTEVRITLPHSITTWIIQAVSVSPTHGVCVSDPQTAISFKKVFLHINLPYSIKQYEQVEIQATVFNYGSKHINASVIMYESPGICTATGTQKTNEKRLFNLKPKSARTVSFPVIPLLVEALPIRFLVFSTEGSDVIERKLNVVPRGKREYENVVRKLDPSNMQNRHIRDVNTTLFTDSIDASQNLQVISFAMSFPVGTVPGTASCTISATGDPVGPVVETTLNNPDALIQMPSGCGEQNMVRLAPTIYMLGYLNSTNKLTPQRKENAFKYIRAGYSNMLRFKSSDGSYSFWGGGASSIRLTAYIMKVFCQGSKFVPHDRNVINSGIRWLQSKQGNDGSFGNNEGGGGGDVYLTAYVLTALEECKSNTENLSESRRRARTYLETKINTVQSPFSAAVLAYALALANSNQKIVANQKLLSLAKIDQIRNYIYWTTGGNDIETAGYGLLTQLLMNDSGRSTSIANWLYSQQSKSGWFRSTQDTVIALQSLSAFGPKTANAGVNLVSILTSSSNKNFTKILRFNNTNSLEAQAVTIENPEGKIFVTTSGTGSGTIAMQLEYNVLKPKNETCKFHINETVTVVDNVDAVVGKAIRALNQEPQRRKKRQIIEVFGNEQGKLVYEINICLRYFGEGKTGMSIADVGIFSGFEAHEEDLQKLQDDPNHLIEKYEKSSRNIVFYLKEVPTQDYCFSFRIIREFVVGNTQSSVIKVYDYYNPDVCTKFYSPGKDSPLIRTICTGDLCICAEGGCPPRSLPGDVLSIANTADRRDRMKEMFCEEFNYAWLGKLAGRQRKAEGYIQIPFNITEVLKNGIEETNQILNSTRILRAHDYCETAIIFGGATYLILGKDPINSNTREEVLNGYFLDKNSLVHHWVPVKRSTKKVLQEDLEEVRLAMKKDGCG